VDNIIGVVKAYSTCVGAGPFVVEWHGDEAHALREAGKEYGAATGRPRRVGPFDAVATRYGVRVQGAKQLALTKLDVISSWKTIPVCVAYEIDGKKIEEFPSVAEQDRAKPVYEYLDGIETDISHCRTIADLPAAALAYVTYVEKAVGAKVKWLSVGADRDAYVTFP